MIIQQDTHNPRLSEDSEVEKAKRDPGAFHRNNSRKAITDEVKRMMKAQGAYVPAAWARTWGPARAMWLAYYVAYTGTQSNPEGFIYDSAKTVEAKTGINARTQERYREFFEKERFIDTKTGGIGNKTHVRVNMVLLGLVDEIDGTASRIKAGHAEGAASKPGREETGEEHPTQSAGTPQEEGPPHANCGNHPTQNAGTTSRKLRKPITSNSGCNSSPTPTRPRDRSSGAVGPTHSDEMTQREEIKKQGQIGRCVDVLTDTVNVESRVLEKMLEVQVSKYPRVNPVQICESYRNYSSTHAVANHQALLARFFEKAAEEVAAEPINPHSPEGTLARAKPNPLVWYASLYGDVPNVEAEVEQLMDAGQDHEAIVEVLEGLQRERERPGELDPKWVERLLARADAGKATRDRGVA